MDRKFRLRKSTDISRVRRNGKSFAHPLIVLIVHPNLEGQTRMGVIASRTMGGAVQRNRAKRRIRAVFQLFAKDVSPGWDLLLIARKPLPQADFNQLKNALKSLFMRAKILN